MTPDDVLGAFRRMLRARRFREMVELTVRVLPAIRSQMTPEHANQLHEIMHVADTVADLEGSAGDTASDEVPAQVGRPA
jgi:hypothetical protein